MLQLLANDQALWGIIVITLIAMGGDLVTAVGMAAAKHTFSLAELDTFVSTHLLPRVIPIITGTLFVAVADAALQSYVNPIPSAASSAISALWIAAWAAAMAYFAVTAGSVLENFKGAPPPPAPAQ